MTETFENNGRFFIKSFLLDSSLNLNRWGVTKDALLDNLNSFIGKPFVLTPEFGHPEAATGDELLIIQENYRVGNIIEVGYETTTGKAFAVSEITDADAIRLIQNGEPMFVSPSIVFSEEDVINEPYTRATIAKKFEGAHLAGVKDPAYGMQKAQIKGKCAGDAVSCRTQLSRVQASTEYPIITKTKCGKFTRIETETSVFVTAASECVSNCLSKKKDEGKAIDDQAIAICLSECGESKEANIDPESLDNITTPCHLETDEPKVKCSSHKANQEEPKVMDFKKAQEEEKKEDEEKKEESKKAQEEEEKKDEEKVDAEEDEDMKKLKDEVAKLQAELQSVKANVRQAAIEPLANSVLAAKQKLNMVKEADVNSEMKKLMALDESTLSQLKAEYDGIISQRNTPKYTIKYAARDTIDSSDKLYLDSVMRGMK